MSVCCVIFVHHVKVYCSDCYSKKLNAQKLGRRYRQAIRAEREVVTENEENQGEDRRH